MELVVISFFVGLFTGVFGLMVWNKLSSGSASPKNVKQEYEAYQAQVETHFEETSKKFKDMTEQYQDLYKHLAVGATSLCRPDSVAAALVDDSNPEKVQQLESTVKATGDEAEASKESVNSEDNSTDEAPTASADNRPSSDKKTESKKTTEEQADSSSAKEETPAPAEPKAGDLNSVADKAEDLMGKGADKTGDTAGSKPN